MHRQAVSHPHYISYLYEYLNRGIHPMWVEFTLKLNDPTRRLLNCRNRDNPGLPDWIMPGCPCHHPDTRVPVYDKFHFLWMCLVDTLPKTYTVVYRQKIPHHPM